MDEVIPIREISRLTGVNSVTLRAWERRYGLIKPLRTNKGHRLYQREDVELIKTIQAWLARGLAIGKVSELLESGQAAHETAIENIWQTYSSELKIILADLNLGKLDAFFNQLFSVYPAALVADQLISPILDTLSQNSFGNSLKQAILVSRLSEYLLMLTQRQRQQTGGKRLAIIQLNTATNPLLNVLLHYSLTMNQIKSELVGLISPEEIVFAVEQLQLDALIVYNQACTSLGEYQKELVQLAQKTSVPIIVGGNLSSVLSRGFPAHLVIAQDGGQQTIVSIVDNIFPRSELGLAEESV
jgi:MerR family transcriptional regulator, light-induced transcriptional regulator